MKIICDSCQTKYSIADEKVRGKVFKIKCKKCSHIIVVRGAAEPAPVDDKETQVFDYSGYDSPSEAAAAMAAAASGGAVWHVVIDQEQVGPLTRDEVLERLERGEVTADSYIWREGFGDWQRLAAVEEFAGVVGAGTMAASGEVSSGAAAVAGLHDDGHPPPDPEVAGMFGIGGGYDEPAAAGDPGDLFSAAAAPSAAEPDYADAGGGLFGGDGAAADAGGGLFGGAEPAAEPAPVGPTSLTGQRNENSVLFSLSNLASLAADAPKAGPAPAASGGAQPGYAQSGGQEGSGLIDIRSMAQVYLGEKQAAGSAGPSAAASAPDDLPVFNTGGFEGGAAVLLPTATPAGNNKLLYALIGLIGVLAIVAVVLVLVILKSGDKPGADTPQLAAAAAASDKVGGGATPAGGARATASDQDDSEPAKAGGEGGDSEPKPAATGDEGAKGDDDDDGAPAAGDEASKASGGSDRRGGDRRADSRRKSSSRRESSSRDRKPPPRRRGDSSDRRASSDSSGGGSKCDEVACLVDPSLPCCKKSRGSRSGGSSGGSSRVDPNLPERPSRTDITKGIGSVRGRVISCGDRHDFKGTATVKIKVGASGKVESASVNKGSGAFKSCVTSAVKNARFSKSQKGITVNYPFVFR